MNKILSIIIPVYNEAKTLSTLLKKVEAVRLPEGVDKEIILVDDGSTDGSRDFLRGLGEDYKVILQAKNRGKGYAIRSGFENAHGDILIIQDADLEYDPNQYSMLIGPILEGKADVVYGSRFITNHARRVLYFKHFLANQFLTLLSNFFTDLNLSDMETCYKVFNRKVINNILPHLRSDRFGIEVELTAEVAKHHFRVYEIGISYDGRTYEEGKKINWRDGVAALFQIIWYNLRNCPKP